MAGVGKDRMKAPAFTDLVALPAEVDALKCPQAEIAAKFI